MDGSSLARCMVVGLTSEQEEACRRAIVPVEVVRGGDVREACASMSTVLPLVVVVGESLSDADRSVLIEYTTACGAEIVTLDPSVTKKAFAGRLLDALRVAELRRLGARG